MDRVKWYILMLMGIGGSLGAIAAETIGAATACGLSVAVILVSLVATRRIDRAGRDEVMIP